MKTDISASIKATISTEEPILLFFDESGFNYKKQAIEEKFIPAVQSVVEAYNDLEFEEWEGSTKRPLLPGELSRLFREPVDFIFDKMTRGEAVAIGGVKVNKAKAIDILERPAGYNNLLSTIERCISSLRHDVDNITVTVPEVSDWFELADDNTVTLIKARLDEISEQYKRYAKEDRAKRMLAFANGVAQAAKEAGIESEIANDANGFGHVLKHLFSLPVYRQFPKLDVDTINRYNSKAYTP